MGLGGNDVSCTLYIRVIYISPKNRGTVLLKKSRVFCVFFLYSSCVLKTAFKLNYNVQYYFFTFSLFFLPPEVTIDYRHGLPVITLMLPTRSERCQFTIKPVVTTVEAFLQDVQREDKGVERAEVFAAGILQFCHSSKWIHFLSSGIFKWNLFLSWSMSSVLHQV